MQIQLQAHKSVARHAATAEHVGRVVSKNLERHADQISRVEVHLGESASQKPNDADLRCMMEARVANHPPVAVTHHAGNLHQAIDGASEKLRRAVATALARQAARRSPAPEFDEEEE